MKKVSGEFVERRGERFYAIHNVDAMEPFLVSVVSNSDHWLYASSIGSLTAGRVSSDRPLFPYITDDKLHDAGLHNGSRTVVRVGQQIWQPFNREQNRAFSTTRNLYKNVLGNKLCFEEINHDLDLTFRVTWQTSDTHGFVRECELEGTRWPVELLDGVQNIVPAGTPSIAQMKSSNLVDAYKWSEYNPGSGLALYTLASEITDRAEPSESLHATTAFQLGLESPKILLCARQLERFCAGGQVDGESLVRGRRGAFFVQTTLDQASRWCLVADVHQTQSDVVRLNEELKDRSRLDESVTRSVVRGSDGLSRIMASSDAFQTTAEETVSVHHYANVLFNVLRGGIVRDDYRVCTADLLRTIELFNTPVFARHRTALAALPDRIEFSELFKQTDAIGDPQLRRLILEYLPVTFGRRHGDPSRPWNRFEIKLTDERGEPLLSYQGNWRDIFQNWEALAWSYPNLVENMIAKFVNASTMDGYNPYRITKQGIDWEVEDPDDPWSYIGYWGDHQIIYLLKLLELLRSVRPERLGELLGEPLFAYANVPYRIQAFDALVDDPKNTIRFDDQCARQIDEHIGAIGSDGKLVLDAEGEVYQVNLLEKLLVPLLAKLGNLVVDGGVWMNTQRPEWNDANNALVGQGLSMVTLCYVRRYLKFLEPLLPDSNLELSIEVDEWFEETAAALLAARERIGDGEMSPEDAFRALSELGQASSRYRARIYRQGRPSGKRSRSLNDVRNLISCALFVVERSINSNRRDNGLYHAYNTLTVHHDRAVVQPLSLMLEGQVAVLSSGVLTASEALSVVESLFASAVYRPDQRSFMLYPDRELPGFLAKNRVDSAAAKSIPLVATMLSNGDSRVVLKDIQGQIRFNPHFSNVSDLHAALDECGGEYDVERHRSALAELYESTFNHRSFTGRSGTMFGFEGLGSIYWHMVSKLLLAVQENFFSALDAELPEARQLGEVYYRVREGIGFNKTPSEYGAFPTDPYSHTPMHAGARQPGMTGQVKEEIITRFGELGLRIQSGEVVIQPALLRAQEFVADPQSFRFCDIDSQWREIDVPKDGLAFSWCQVPFVYRRDVKSSLSISMKNGETHTLPEYRLNRDLARQLLGRTGKIRRIDLSLPPGALFDA